MQQALDNWHDLYDTHTTAQTAALAARDGKDGGIEAIETPLRPLVNRIQANPVVTDPLRHSLGLTVRSTTRTAAAVPSTQPVATIDTSKRLQQTITFVDELTPSNRAKPPGVSGCEIWVKVGSAPTDPSELSFLAVDTRSPYVAEYDGADAGKIAYYMLRWINTRGERGPWSQTVSATITG